MRQCRAVETHAHPIGVAGDAIFGLEQTRERRVGKIFMLRPEHDADRRVLRRRRSPGRSGRPMSPPIPART
jgi:hypothetical protein